MRYGVVVSDDGHLRLGVGNDLAEAVETFRVACDGARCGKLSGPIYLVKFAPEDENRTEHDQGVWQRASPMARYKDSVGWVDEDHWDELKPHAGTLMCGETIGSA